MKYVNYNDKFIIRIDKGEELVSTLKNFCEKKHIKNGIITGIGATDKVVISIFDHKQKVYKKKTLKGTMEITSLLGNVSNKDKNAHLHLHINVSNNQLQVYGGHLDECYISTTCEIILEKVDGHISRKHNEEIGLDLLDFVI